MKENSKKCGKSVYSQFLIARCNLCKAKAQTAAIVVLILVAAFMLNLWLMLSTDYKKNFDRYHDKLNAEHVTLAIEGHRDAKIKEFISETLEKNANMSQYYMSDVLTSYGTLAYNGGEVNMEFVFIEKEEAQNRLVGSTEIVEEGEAESGIYLPMIYGIDDNIAVGKTIELTMGDHVVSYPICGFLNSVMTGSHNCSLCAFMLTSDLYQELEEKGFAFKSTLVSIRLKDKTESEDFEARLKDEISSKYPSVHPTSNSYELVSTSRYISQMICAGIVSVMAFLVTLISLVVIVSNVINYIQENMRQLGVLKAIGYKSRQIIFALMLQFLGITVIAVVVGVGLSYCLFPAINEMMISQTGIPYTIRFLPLPFAVTILFLGGAVAFSVWLSSRRIKKIEPVIALRQGIQTHNFKHNHIPLTKSHVPLNFALALKTTLSGLKQNITICITMFVLSIALVFSGLMIKNVIIDMQPFVDLVMGEMADSCININAEIEDEFLKEMKERDCVSNCYLFTMEEVRHMEGVALRATLSDDFSKVNNQDMCIKGHFPQYDNEAVIGAKYAREKGLEVGDEITLTADGHEAKYIISGFTQISNNFGKDCLLTRSGYERMGELQALSYYINITNGKDIDIFNEEISKQFEDRVNDSINQLSLLNGAASVYVALMEIIVIAILVLSVVVITFVLYLLARTLLNNKKQDYGILKALGFTTKQLILQTAVSFMPAVILSAVVGLIVSSLIINPLTALFLGGLGIVKCTFALPVGFIIAAGVGLVVLAFGIASFLSLRIRKIAPRALLLGE